MVKNVYTPPGIAKWILSRIYLYNDLFAIANDIEEEYYEKREQVGRLRAWGWYWSQVIQVVSRYIIHSVYGSTAMYKNYIKTIFRNLKRNKAVSIINLSGLSIGIASCILILGYVGFELSYDRFHDKADDIYRVAMHGTLSGRTMDAIPSPAPYGPALKQDFPEVADFVRFEIASNVVFRYGEDEHYESKIFYADDSIFRVFSFKLLAGDPETALKESNTIVISEEIAEKYFGNGDPIGKTITMNNEDVLTVTGVMDEVPSNSHLSFGVLISFKTLFSTNQKLAEQWVPWRFYTYILLVPGSDHKALEEKLIDFNERHIGFLLKAMKVTDFRNYLQPLKKIHLYSKVEFEIGKIGDIRYVYAFGIIAVFILFIACINYVNLSTAGSTRRAKEVGIRKVVGAERKRLIFQFLSEAVVFTVIATIAAIIAVEIIHPVMQSILGSDIGKYYRDMPVMTAGLIVLVLLSGILSGSYSAFYLSGFSPVRVLKGEIVRGKKVSVIRNILVVFQFAISIALIVMTSFVYGQVNFLKNKDLGFRKEHLMVISIEDNVLRKKIETIKTELLSVSGVTAASSSSMVPCEDDFNVNPYHPDGWSDEMPFMMNSFYVDHDFFNTYNIEIMEGRGFSKDIITDTKDAVIINETAVKKLQWKDPIGKTIEEYTSTTTKRGLTVIGVIKDIHYRSLGIVIEPCHIKFSPQRSDRLTLSLSGSNIAETVRAVTEKWKEVAPGSYLNYSFLSDSLEELYRSEEKLETLFKIFTFFAVFIACLGLFGLSMYLVEQRKKEIGIRKVLGSPNRTLLA
ncbi:MAG: FtsX-like permease family protein, partial [bacterium]|nr:FtsX-like permease family protein [bacterium]